MQSSHRDQRSLPSIVASNNHNRCWRKGADYLQVPSSVSYLVRRNSFHQDRGSFSGLEATICIPSAWNLPLVDVCAGVNLD
jgi:hypothetical protein